MSRKEYVQRERLYVQEYVNERYPDREFVIYNVALGPPPEELTRAHPELDINHFRRWRLYGDAIVGWRGVLLLVEAKLRDAQSGIGYLIQYAPLVPQTPELANYANRPVQLRLVTPRADPRVIQVAATQGITVDIFSKPWVQEYLASLGLA